MSRRSLISKIDEKYEPLEIYAHFRERVEHRCAIGAEIYSQDRFFICLLRLPADPREYVADNLRGL